MTTQRASRTDPVDTAIQRVLATRLSRRETLRLAVAASAATFLAACGRPSESGTPPSGAPTSSAPPIQASPGASVAPSAGGGQIRMMGAPVISNADPRVTLGPDGGFVRKNVFHTLLKVDAASGDVTPLLAADLPTKDDDVTWTVHLPTDLTWHDDTPFSADDVVYTVEWMLDPANASIFGSVVLDGVDRVETVDDATVRFHLKRPIGSFLERLAAIAPVPRKAAEAMGAEQFKLAPVGLGPFMFKEFVQDDHETIVRWDGYTFGPKALIESASLARVDEGTARVNALQTGQAEVDTAVDPELFGVLAGSGLQTLVADNDAGYNAIIINNGVAPFNDKRVRQAISHAINREDIVKGVWNGNAEPLFGPLPSWYFMADQNIPKFDYDPARATALLKDAGVAPGTEIELMQGTYSTGLNMAAVLQQQLEAVGFKVRIKTGDGNGLYQYVFDKTWQTFSMTGNTSIVGLYPDVMTRWTLQTVFNNASEAELAPLTEALQQADAIPSNQVEERRAAYAAIQAMYADEQRIVFIVNRKGLYAWRNGIQGLVFEPDEVPDVLSQVTIS